MARVEFSKFSGIAGLSGKLGDLIFYQRDGKQYVKRASRAGKSRVNKDNGRTMEG